MMMTNIRMSKLRQIHPGWLSPPKSPTVMIAISLGVLHSDLVAQMQVAVDHLVVATLLHAESKARERYLAKVDARDLADQAAQELGSHAFTLTSPAQPSGRSGETHWYLNAASNHGGFGEYICWYITDDWGDDAWFELHTENELQDKRLRDWLDDPVNQSVDFGNFILEDDVEPQV